MITSLDDQVGRIVAALEKRGLRENTLIIFSSDNGGPRNAVVASGAHSKEERSESGVRQESLPASNGELRGGKGSLYEGGVRTPTIVNWPAKLKPRVVNEPLHMVDIMPTVLALAGGRQMPTSRAMEKIFGRPLPRASLRRMRTSWSTSKHFAGRSSRANGSS